MVPWISLKGGGGGGGLAYLQEYPKDQSWDLYFIFVLYIVITCYQYVNNIIQFQLSFGFHNKINGRVSKRIFYIQFCPILSKLSA
jgi:hypothetical protein